MTTFPLKCNYLRPVLRKVGILQVYEMKTLNPRKLIRQQIKMRKY